MVASYKKLFKLMIDREMKGKELVAKAGISPTTLAKMKKDGATVSSDVLVKICTALDCKLDDIFEIISEEKAKTAEHIITSFKIFAPRFGYRYGKFSFHSFKRFTTRNYG